MIFKVKVELDRGDPSIVYDFGFRDLVGYFFFSPSWSSDPQTSLGTRERNGKSTPAGY